MNKKRQEKCQSPTSCRSGVCEVEKKEGRDENKVELGEKRESDFLDAG